MTDFGQKMVSNWPEAPARVRPMEVILTDISAWTVYASGAPLIPVPQAEAIRVIESARASSATASMVRGLVWWKSWEPYARALLGLPEGRSVPVHLMVAPCCQHGGRGTIKCHVAPQGNMRGFLCKTSMAAHGGKPIYVVSPAAYPLIRARRLEELGVADLLAQMWSDFLVRPDLGGVIRYRSAPLCCKEEVETMLASLPSVRGGVQLQKALGYVSPGAHSPMEVVLQLALCLPQNLGGCGLPLPAMNKSMPLPGDARALFRGQRRITPDLAWLEKGLVVEYDSYQEHDQTEAQAQKDRNRRDAYERMGLRTITVDRNTMRDDTRRNLAFAKIANYLECEFDWSGDAQIKRHDLAWRLMHLQTIW